MLGTFLRIVLKEWKSFKQIHFLRYATVKMTTSGQICKMSYTAYCNMGQLYCIILFAVLFHPYKLISLYNVALYGCRKATRKEKKKKKKKTEEEKEDDARARDICK